MRFSLATLLLIVAVLALSLAAVGQYRQRNQLRKLSARIEEHEAYARIQGRINEYIASLATDRDEDLEALRLVRDLMPQPPPPRPHWKPVTREENRVSFQELIDVDGVAGWLEVLSLSKRPLPHPSHDYSINVLFNGPSIVDVLILRSTQMEDLDVEFNDYNEDGTMDLIVHEQVMFDKRVIRYALTPDGFDRELDTPSE